ncbi:hypothetical protein [Halostella sp. PRR32]|uniref:hypothetical protein n=1 Tax=Halostella sp. PRR32 TaxID=3098147 RepID=UPI002B1DD0CD|nr:hypothetical protein [Halostella sp. PRR32]
MNGDSRDRGILSQADRAYLRGEADLATVQSERNTRARIRDRIYDAVLDFELVVGELTDHDRKLIFEKRLAETEGTEAFDALVSAVAFLYQATGDTELDFETVLKEGINVAEATDERVATVDFDLTFRSLTVEQLRNKLDSGEELSLTEIAYLHDSDEVRMDELARYFGDSDAVTSEIDDGRIQSKVTNF